MDKKVRMIVEFEIDNEMVEEQEITNEKVFNGIVLKDSDVIDGFEITTNIDGFDCSLDFFLTNGKIVSKEII